MTITKTKAEPKLSVIPKGHWRNKWRSDRWADRTAGEGITGGRWPSREVAEERALRAMRGEADWSLGQIKYYHITYLGPVFFPEDAQ